MLSEWSEKRNFGVLVGMWNICCLSGVKRETLGCWLGCGIYVV